MCRPRSSFVHQTILSALVALAAGGCGKGLYTHAQVRSSDGSGGGVIEPGSESGTGGMGSGTGGTGSGSTSPDTGGSTAGTSGSSSVDPSRLDAGSGQAVTKSGNYDSELTIPSVNNDATLFIPKRTLPKDGPYDVTLALVSSDGNLPNLGGAMGPIYSITAQGGVWNDAAILSIHIPSALGLSSQKIGVAYLDQQSGGWIAIQTPQPTYDETTGWVRGSVAWFPGIRYFAPFETCTKAGQDGGSCRPTSKPASLRCWGEACQQ